MTKSKAPAPTVHRVSRFMVFVLIAMLAVLSLIAVMLGIQIYNNAVGTAETNSMVRTSLAYLAGRVRAGDASGMIALWDADGVDVVVLGSYDEGELYHTYIYFYDGALREYYADAQNAFNPVYGANATIAELSAFDVTFENNLFRFTVTDNNGVVHEMHVYVNTDQTAPIVQEGGAA